VTASSPVVLVVDDDPLVLATLAMQIRRAGLSVVEVSHGEAALDSCAGARPDIALIDYRLPGLSGVELISRLRQGWGVSAVLLTGEDDAAVGDAARDAGAVAVLVKPLDVARIPALLRELVAAASCETAHTAELATGVM
jgi:CheY-like chemotaxis protein